MDHFSPKRRAKDGVDPLGRDAVTEYMHDSFQNKCMMLVGMAVGKHRIPVSLSLNEKETTLAEQLSEE